MQATDSKWTFAVYMSEWQLFNIYLCGGKQKLFKELVFLKLIHTRQYFSRNCSISSKYPGISSQKAQDFPLQHLVEDTTISHYLEMKRNIMPLGEEKKFPNIVFCDVANGFQLQPKDEVQNAIYYFYFPYFCLLAFSRTCACFIGSLVFMDQFGMSYSYCIAQYSRRTHTGDFTFYAFFS